MWNFLDKLHFPCSSVSIMRSKLAQLQLANVSLMQSSTPNISIPESAASCEDISTFSCSTFPDIDSMQIQSDTSDDSDCMFRDHSPTNSESSDIPIADLILNIAKSDENITIYKHGYDIIDRLGNSLQGELFKAEVITNNKNVNIGSHVMIKKTEKILFTEQIAVQDGVTFCVSENIVKEAIILKHLTINCKSNMSRDYIAQFVDFFETDSHFYLVTEYIPNSMNLKQFISKYHQLINGRKEHKKAYLRWIKFIMWQLTTIIHWLHSVYNCCHLDLALENIVIENGLNVGQPDGSFNANCNIRVVLVDFGVAEIFQSHPTKNNSFKCNKQRLTIDECNISPQTYNEQIFDARAHDMWAVGLILYECIIGKKLYTAHDIIWREPLNGFDAVICNNNLCQYLTVNNLIKYFQNDSLLLLKDLLLIDENQRINSVKLLKHSWFKSYYSRYKKILKPEFIADKKLFQHQIRNINNFPFY
eukprot:523374_1